MHVHNFKCLIRCYELSIINIFIWEILPFYTKSFFFYSGAMAFLEHLWILAEPHIQSRYELFIYWKFSGLDMYDIWRFRCRMKEIELENRLENLFEHIQKALAECWVDNSATGPQEKKKLCVCMIVWNDKNSYMHEHHIHNGWTLAYTNIFRSSMFLYFYTS
jgi:hypothetical protein